MVKYPVYLVLIGILVLSIFSVQGFSNSLEVRVNVAPKIVQQGNHINIEVFVVGVSNGSMLNASIMYGNRTILRLFDQEVLNNGTFHANIKVTIGYDWPVGNYTVKVSKPGYLPQSKAITILENQTITLNFSLSGINLYINIKTTKDNYGIGEVVNLTDPVEGERKEEASPLCNLFKLIFERLLTWLGMR